jgi:hypothetical protein
MGRETMGSRHSHVRYEDALRARFRQTTGRELSNVRALPPDLLRRPSPSPIEILERLAVRARTANLLRRHIAQHRIDGAWTCGRLMTIRGFGLTALLDVLAALPRAQPGRRPTSLLERALHVVLRSLPATEGDIARRLHADAALRGRFDLADLVHAVRHREEPPPFAVLRRGDVGVVVPSDRLPVANLILALSARAIVNWGLVPIRYIAFRARCADLDFVSALLATKDTFRWIHRPLGWFWFETPSPRLVRAIEKVLSLGRPVALTDLARTLFKRRPPEVIPPLLVLRELCRRLPQLVIAGNMVRLAPARAPDPLTPADHEILALFRNWGPRIDGFKLPLIAEKVGLGAEALLRFLRSSFWVIEPQPGVFQLVGT